jgi:hypothetical protein
MSCGAVLRLSHSDIRQQWKRQQVVSSANSNDSRYAEAQARDAIEKMEAKSKDISAIKLSQTLTVSRNSDASGTDRVVRELGSRI